LSALAILSYYIQGTAICEGTDWHEIHTMFETEICNQWN